MCPLGGPKDALSWLGHRRPLQLTRRSLGCLAPPWPHHLPSSERPLHARPASGGGKDPPQLLREPPQEPPRGQMLSSLPVPRLHRHLCAPSDAIWREQLCQASACCVCPYWVGRWGALCGAQWTPVIKSLALLSATAFHPRTSGKVLTLEEGAAGSVPPSLLSEQQSHPVGPRLDISLSKTSQGTGCQQPSVPRGRLCLGPAWPAPTSVEPGLCPPPCKGELHLSEPPLSVLQGQGPETQC